MSQAPQADWFEQWWRAYPLKVGKIAARREWDKLRVDQAMLVRMVDTLAWQCLQPAWLKDGGRYVPHPRTYLHQGRFEDEPFNPPPPARWAPRPWDEECQRLHGGRCGNVHMHHAKMLEEAEVES